jgi:hypothetical protein
MKYLKGFHGFFMPSEEQAQLKLAQHLLEKYKTPRQEDAKALLLPFGDWNETGRTIAQSINSFSTTLKESQSVIVICRSYFDFPGRLILKQQNLLTNLPENITADYSDLPFMENPAINIIRPFLKAAAPDCQTIEAAAAGNSSADTEKLIEFALNNNIPVITVLNPVEMQKTSEINNQTELIIKSLENFSENNKILPEWFRPLYSNTKFNLLYRDFSTITADKQIAYLAGYWNSDIKI